MKKRYGLIFALAVVSALLHPAGLAAQNEKIALRIVPRPNQVIQIGMTQQMQFNIEIPGMAVGPMKMDNNMVVQCTEKVGPADSQGRITAQVTYDTMRVDMRMNGNPMPTGGGLDSILGRPMTMVYDAQGKIADVSGGGAAGDRVKQMLGMINGNLPSVTMSIGDTITVPNSTGVPLNLPGMGGQTPTNVDSKITFKLVSITSEGGDRIASLEQTTIATTSGAFDMHMTGTGTMQVNVDKGFVKSGSSDMKLDATMPVPGGEGTMKMSGTIHMTMTGSGRAQ